MTVAPPKPPPASPPKQPPAKPASNAVPSKKLGITSGVNSTFQRIGLYGPGGSGKSELCSNLKQLGIRPLFIDIGNGTGFLDVDRVTPQSWDEMRAVLHDTELLAPFGAIILDDMTRAEELAVEWTLKNVPHEKGHLVGSVEGYGFGKGLTHVYETFLCLLGDLDAQARNSKQVVAIAHECVFEPENPEGENYSQYQPRLQSPKSGKNSIRHRFKEWCDHLLFLNFDVFVDKDGKAQGSGSRTIYPTPLPGFWAKSRHLDQPIPYARGSADLWKQLFKA